MKRGKEVKHNESKLFANGDTGVNELKPIRNHIL